MESFNLTLTSGCRRAGVFGKLLLALTLMAAPVALLAQTCVPPSSGVPPAFEPPHWWDNTGPQPVYYQRVDDPRWEGSAAISKGDGTSEINSFLAVQDGTYLYLSWRYRGMLSGGAGQNALYIGYERKSDGHPLVAKAELPNLVAVGAGALTPEVHDLNASGTLGGLAPPASGWPSLTRVWINNPVANSYTISARIPIADLKFDASSNFKLWFEMLAGSPAAQVTRFVWPRTGAIITEQASFPFDKLFPQPSAWESFRLSTGPSDASCPSESISLAQSNIATKNPNPLKILYKKSPAAKPENVLYARPTNHSTTTDIAAGQLKATFRIANWGSQADWEDVDQPLDTLWAKIPCVGADGAGAVSSLGIIPKGGLPAPEANELRCRWTLTDAELAPFKNGTQNDHSCILVEMQDTLGLVYRNRSMWNNFDVGEASVLQAPAQITLKGLPVSSGGARDVYVFVETLNMPEKVSRSEGNPNDGPGNAGVSYAGAPRSPARERSFDLRKAIRSGQVRAADLSRMMARGDVSSDTLDAEVPTYIVRVYHDTGERLTIGGVKHAVLNPQGSFGYRVTHAGDLYGWRHSLGFESGYVIDTLAPNYFRIRNVPDNGVVNVTTRIEALETPPLAGGKRAIWFGLGNTFPTGALGNAYDGDFASAIGFEYGFTPALALETTLALHQFAGSSTAPDLDVTQFGIDAKYYFTQSAFKPFATIGVGGYKFDPGSTKLGYNLGIGAQYALTSKWSLEGRYTYHSVNTSPSAEYSTVLLGARFAF